MKLRTTAKKQLSIVERYVDVESANVYEHFLASLKQLFNAESLCTYILNTLDTFKLDPAGIVSLGYHGALVMSGHCSGVQQRMKQVTPQAMYVYCCLNLELVDTATYIHKIHLHSYVHIHFHMYYTCIHVYMHTYVHTCIHAHIHAWLLLIAYSVHTSMESTFSS